MSYIPEKNKPIEAISPQAGAGITGTYVSLSNSGKCYVLVHINQASAEPVEITIEQATDIEGAGSKALTNVVPIWADQDCAASDSLVRQTDAVAYSTSATLAHKLVVFQINPAQLDVTNGFDCITVKTAASDPTNITAAQYIHSDLRFGG
ncbi:hypothetical protein UF75_1206 [Desulfosporosinus sp. I2]|uniref:hypothetical protein n=1 Tax=Desulfosporosinus sp. I2 TaxID=1617025 RepID=UPI0005F0B2CF|nr:hypothetical protein [Desulfosporosinus sp. I2]KJR48408.1 hypothetical protein UF75_1206 [Desulfosporosinus sp. I2]